MIPGHDLTQPSRTTPQPQNSAQVKFEALEDVSELAITQMISPEKEVVPMMTPVDPVDKSVEVRGAVSFLLH